MMRIIFTFFRGLREKMTKAVEKPIPPVAQPQVYPVPDDDKHVEDEEEFLRKQAESLGWIQKQAEARLARLQAQADARTIRARRR